MSRSLVKTILQALPIVFLPLRLAFPQAQSLPADSLDIWVTAYYAGWSQGWFNNGVLPAEAIDYSAITHIIHFALVPRSDGSLDSNSNSIRPQNAAALVSNAHAAGKKVLISVGGWGTDVSFRGATGPLNLSRFVDNLVGFMTRHGYDGIDVDWEVLAASDAAQYTLFIKLLRQRLNEISPRPLLTAAVIWQSSIFASLFDEFDQINLMTYDLSGAWPGWVTWHNAPITDGSFKFPSTGSPVPSAHGMASTFQTAGVPANKIGIGIDFYGYVWKGGNGTSTGGVTSPRQSWSSTPQVQANVPYYSIIQNYYKPESYRWDSSAIASYLSIDKPGSADDRFVSFDNEVTCREKIEFAREAGLGGVIIWELGGGQLPPSFQYRDRLLQAVKYTLSRTVNSPTKSTPEYPLDRTVGMQIHPTLTWSASPTASWYHLQVSLDSSFSETLIDQPWILMSSYPLRGLGIHDSYYWRVRPSNITASSDWSVSRFRTTADTLLPRNWLFISETGGKGDITIPSNVNPKVGNLALKTGDLVGVFLRDNNSFICGGYELWKDREDMHLSAWTDDPLTAQKDGFTEGDTIFFKIWNSQKHREYEAYATYQTGGPTFFNGGQYILKSLNGTARMMHHMVLAKGANMMSSHIVPSDSSLDSITAGFTSKIILMLNSQRLMFWPDSGINTIGKWNPAHAYEVYMKENAGLTIIGDEISPELTPIEIQNGWNLVPYIRNISLAPDSALGSISASLLLAKDNDGYIFWPEFNVNTMGTMKPGQAYKIYAINPATLVYPANQFLPVSWQQLPSSARGLAHSKAARYPPLPSTGQNSTILIQSAAFRDGDEVAAWTEDRVLVGRGDVLRGHAVVTIWGRNEILQNISTLGAREGEALTFTHWSQTDRWEYTLTLTQVQNAVSRDNVELPVRYASDDILMSLAKTIPRTFFLAQNYPNPFNAATTISYGLASQMSITLEIFNSLGQKVAVLEEGRKSPGQHEITFENEMHPSGVYFYRLTATPLDIPQGDVWTPVPQSGMFRETRKMVLLK
ncbi:MAG: T9SS type A sorting domain-containing protein [Ignavibacteriales bacterium]|nr:T9SS type A sorting domain-containing protein [Ignavibacteriales bacterium]